MDNKLMGILKKVILISFIVAFFYLLTTNSLNEVFKFENIANLVDSSGMYGPLIFVVIYIVGLLMFVPASLFTIAGGLLFGALWGTFYVVFAATIAAGIGFLIARKFSHKFDFARSNYFTKKLVLKCEGQCEEKGLQTFIILRLLFVPYMALSFAAGIVRTAKFNDFLLATFLTNIVGSFSFAYFGSQLNAGWRALIVPAILIALTLFIPKIVKRYQKEKVGDLK
jgi:uncharacterized membrane protein YdjX (TVP38/TMEM64 family)